MTTKTEEIFKLSAPYKNPYQGDSERLLFVCSAGILRSATSATIAAKMGYNARSCGTAEYALIPLSVNLIFWADHIFFVNEENFKAALKIGFEDSVIETMGEKTTVWNIKDVYDYMEPRLVEVIESKLSNYKKMPDFLTMEN